MILGFDLGFYPITYDFVNWLVRVENARIESGEEAVKIVVQPGEDEDGFRLKTMRDYQFTQARKRWRLENILVPLANRVPSIASVVVSPVRLDVPTPKIEISSAIYEVPVNPLCASEAALASISLLYPQPFVAVTIRDSDVQPQRNSSQKDWKRVCNWLHKQGLRPVVVPDTDAVLSGRRQHVWDDACVPASINMDLRLALYELAQFCCFTSGGPMMTAMFDAKVNYAAFKMLCEDRETACTAAQLDSFGMKNGASRGPYRKIWWAEDRFETIIPQLTPFLDIKSKVRVQDCLSARTHYRGQPIRLKH